MGMHAPMERQFDDGCQIQGRTDSDLWSLTHTKRHSRWLH